LKGLTVTTDGSGPLQDAIASGDRRISLVALRDYLAHELEGNRCKSCAMSQLRTGDTAALVLRLTKVMEELEAIPDTAGTVSELDQIRARRAASVEAGLGTKNGPRRQGGRKTS
jgi:hypothetical protein